jgi:hypothetical protein
MVGRRWTLDCSDGSKSKSTLADHLKYIGGSHVKYVGEGEQEERV